MEEGLSRGIARLLIKKIGRRERNAERRWNKTGEIGRRFKAKSFGGDEEGGGMTKTGKGETT
jgi:hypothetical protein